MLKQVQDDKRGSSGRQLRCSGRQFGDSGRQLEQRIIKTIKILLYNRNFLC